MFLCVCVYVSYDCLNCMHVGPCKGFRKRSYEPGSPFSFAARIVNTWNSLPDSVALFKKTVG